MKKKIIFFLVFLSVFSFQAETAPAQFTTAFTYQGKLTDGGAPANGQYDFTFRLFAAQSGGTSIGTDMVINDLQVSGGIFTVNLDFGESPFNTATGNYLEISVRQGASTGAFTMLSPRQPITSSPYAVQTIKATTAEVANNALKLGGVAANQFVQTNDSRLSDARNPLAGSANYIQNSTSQQPLSNFNISGSGTLGETLSANIVNAATQYNIGGVKVMSILGTGANTSILVGGAGANASGSFNSFVGWDAGKNNSGDSNSFFGETAGFNNSGSQNSFFGRGAGRLNTTGYFNSFFGDSAGGANTTGNQNSVFGQCAGCFYPLGNSNSLFGFGAGWTIDNGSGNSFFGTFAGSNNSSGSYNTFLGSFTNVGAANLTNAGAIGWRAYVTQNNSLVLGSINEVNGATADTNVGIGTTAPKEKLHIANGSIFVANPGSLIITSPNGNCWFITVSNAGALSTFSVPCA